PYRISVDGGSPQSAPGLIAAGDMVTVSNLSSGAHTIAIVDANGCGETENITIFPPLTALAVVSSDENCDPANTGEVTVSANGGSGVYTFTQTSPAGPSNGTGVFTGLTHSVSYTFEVEDTSTNCIVPVTITLPAPELPTFSLSATDVSCFGGNDGTITVTLDPGNIDTPYSYSLDGGTTTQPTNVFTGLVAGTYNITVISDKGCEDTKSIAVDEPSLLAISASASAYTCDDTASTITVTIDNDGTGNPSGTGPYLYSFDNGANFGTDNTYQAAYGSAAVNVVVEDSNGCQDTVSVPVPVTQEVTASINQLQIIDCTNGEEIIEIVALNGSGNYTYTQLPSGNVVADPTNIVITAPGNYVYEITDTTTNCSVIVEHNVAPYDLIDAVATVTNDATCSDSTDGTIEVTVTGYIGTFEYEVRDGSGTAVTATIADNAISDPYVFTVPSTFGAGTYTVSIIQTAYPECTVVTNTVTIDAPEPLALTLVDVVNANCNVSDAVVTVLANGGTPAYTYGASQSGAGVPGAFTFDSTIELDPSVSLNWDIYVRDSNGCIIGAPLAVTIAMDPTPGIALSMVDACVPEGTYEVDVTMDVAGVGPYRISVDGGSPQSAPGLIAAGDMVTVSNLSSGAHTIAIVDANGCGEVENITIEPELQISALVNTQPSCLTNNGVIDFNVSGGSGTFTVQLLRSDLTDTGLVPTGNQFIGVAFGDYIVRVTDNTLGTPNCFADAPVSLEEPTPVTLLATNKTDISCAGLSDGSISINLAPTSAGVNDNPPYVYEITDGTNSFTQNNGLFTGLPAGTYDITVTSNRNCIATDQVIIEEPLALDAAVTNITQLSCDVDNSTQTATIEVTITSGTGTPNYFYSVNGGTFRPTGGNVFTYETTIAGNYDIVVRDQNGCPFPLPTQTIAPLNTFTATITTLNSITCDINNPEEVLITVTDDGNPHNYTFELLPIGNPNGVQTSTTATTANYDLTAVGNYTFRITDVDTGCYIDTAPYTIAPFDFIEVTATAVSPVTCFGDGNGTLEFTISGYTGNYNYQVFDSNDNPIGGTVSTDTSVNPRTIGGLSGGNYYVTITEADVPLCDDISNMVTIISPDMPLSAIVDVLAEATCTNDQGEILIDPTGGYAPYNIVMTNTTTGQPAYIATGVQSVVFTGLSAGNFDITVTDASGCPRSYSEVLNPATPIVANATPLITDLACYGDTGAVVTANVIGGGSGSYEYQLNYYDDAGVTITFTTGQQLNPSFNDLGAGIYSITVSDGWNCDVTTNTVEVREPTPVEAFLIRTDPLTCATGAAFELTTIGGSGTYEYSLDNVTFMPMTSNPMGLPATGSFPAGTYQYYVRDAVNGCEAAVSNAITEDPIEPLTLIVDQTAAFINCTGESTAVIYAEATGGLGNYEYELFTDASLALATRIGGPQPTGIFRNLAAGTYYVTVTSEDCNTLPEEVIIAEPIPLSYSDEALNITCAGEDNGSITVTLSGGAGGYLYAISPNLDQFDTINTFTDLAPGDYTVIAQDQNGCFEYLTYTILEPTVLMVGTTSTPEICVGSQDGTITLNVTGGTAPYSTALNANDDSDFVADRLDFMDMAAGNYLIFVRDANGCETNLVVDIAAGVNLNAEVSPVYECTGDTPDNYVNITLEDPTVIGDVLYALDSVDPSAMQLNPDFRSIAPGNHYITIAHANGCILTIDFTIENFDPLTLSLEQQNMNEITAIAEGGRGEYTYYFDGIDNGNDNTYYITRTDTYEVRVVDENGCESIANIFMEFIDIEIPNFFTPDGDGNNDFWIPRNMEQFPEILIKIFDRYGRVVSRQAVDAQGWDGKYEGKELPTGDYWYVIQLNGEADDREFVGHFTLYR
ncbi:T9SS type B sorting domain-containing protein, partial [Maribacter sp. CXY002]|uniref:T9SS type B sorting domain-containing protein n=1 Tax=Maribacter luteocoastalis TaxID=3407671 RepID=UPI003B6702D7